MNDIRTLNCVELRSEYSYFIIKLLLLQIKLIVMIRYSYDTHDRDYHHRRIQTTRMNDIITLNCVMSFYIFIIKLLLLQIKLIVMISEKILIWHA